MTYIVAVSGYKNSGKTTLCRRLLAELDKLCVKTGYIKRTCEDVLSSSADTDSGLINGMNVKTLLWGSDGLCLEFAKRDATIKFIAKEYFPDAEILLLEGGKNIAVPKIWVRKDNEEIPSYPCIFAVYDRNRTENAANIYGLGQEAELALRLSSFAGEGARRSSKIYIGDKELPMKDFIADFVGGGILGMLASLKGGANPKEQVRVYINAKETDENKKAENR